MSLLYSSKSVTSMRVLSDYVIKRDSGEKGFRDSIASMYERNVKWSNPIVRWTVHVFCVIFRLQAKSAKYVFWGTKFEELILSLPQSETCVVGGPKQLIFCLKNRRAFLPTMDLWFPLFQDLKCGSTESNDRHLSSCLSKLSRRLRRILVTDAVLIVDNDSLPAQRAVIQAARSAHIKHVVCIQHGVFQRRSPGYILDGWFSDRFFVIDDNQKDLLVEKGMPENKISVMGFHSSPYFPRRPLSAVQCRKVCLIGQPWGKYGRLREERYLLILNKLYGVFKESGYSVFFKPHPWERGTPYLKELSNVVYSSMEEALEQYDVFVSLTSTALLEAAASGRIAVQIVDPIFDADRFSELGYVVSIDFDDSALETKLMAALVSFRSGRCHEIKPVAQRFLQALNLCK